MYLTFSNLTKGLRDKISECYPNNRCNFAAKYRKWQKTPPCAKQQ
jgi:hypothetical protein